MVQTLKKIEKYNCKIHLSKKKYITFTHNMTGISRNMKGLEFAIVLNLYHGTPLPNDIIMYVMEFVKYDELNNITLKQAVKDYHMSNEIDMWKFQYGPFIGCWKISGVTSFCRLFENMNNFCGNLSGWDVSNVNTMHEMFANTQNFNGDLTGWKISKVICVKDMFKNSDCKEKICSMIEELKHKILLCANNVHFCGCDFHHYVTNIFILPTLLVAPMLTHEIFEGFDRPIVLTQRMTQIPVGF